MKAIVLTENKGEKFNKNEEELENPKDICGSNSAEEVLKGATVSVDAEIEADPFVKEQVSYESENKSDDEKKSIQSPKQSESGGVLNEVLGSKVQSSPFEDLEKRPFSVRTRRLHGYWVRMSVCNVACELNVHFRLEFCKEIKAKRVIAWIINFSFMNFPNIYVLLQISGIQKINLLSWG